MTLIRSNPEFKPEKIKLLHNEYNPQKKDIEEVKNIIRKVDVYSTRLAEVTGRNVNPLDMWGMILIRMGYDQEIGLTNDVLVEVDEKVQKIFLKHLPLPFDANTIPVLEKLHDISFLTIASNTGFISGKTMRKALKEIGMAKFFSGEVFSDECGFAKPSVSFFEHVKNLSFSHHDSAHIIHVGDNVIADIFGADAANIQPYQINSCEETIMNFYTDVMS
jgi:putative hydrolase of the HAD superfamily